MDAKSPEREPRKNSVSVVLERRLLACQECGWVHYVMTAEEKAANDRFLERYQLNDAERFIYESAFRQCLRCESPASEFTTAREEDVARAAGHLVTPVFVAAWVGAH